MGNEKVKMDLRERSYDVQIGSGLIENFDFRKFKGSKYIILVDSTTKQLFSERLVKNLSRQRLSHEVLEIPSGENSKNLSLVENLASELARRKVDKNAIILTLGGGVVGDIGGFLASVYERGIQYIHVPTTLLAQVDSSIGGKTGVNIPEGKNLLGRIHQPLAVLVDVATLETLPEDEIRNGLAEVIKYGVIKDEKLFQYLEDNLENRNREFFLEIIRRSAITKTSVVKKDESEEEYRKILNYGHTIGHAIEILSDHKIPHGEAIAYGMMCEGKIATKLGYLSQPALERQNNLIKRLGFSRQLNFVPSKLVEVISRDKKSLDGKLYFVLPCEIGKIHSDGKKVAVSVDTQTVLDCLSEL